jgi:N-acetyl sugar amidotransferase
MPDTRPGIKFSDEGVCYPCVNWERRKNIDWKARWKELEDLAEKYRGCNGDFYDCIITASAGKDSHYQTYVFKKKLSMNPLLVSIDNFSWTETGRSNLRNLSETFGVDIHLLSINRKVAKKLSRKGFDKELIPNWYWDKAVYAYPLRVAIAFNIPLIVYGENINFEYGGEQTDETYSALEQINNDVVKDIDWDFWLDDEISMKDLNPAVYPTKEEIEKAKLEIVYLSYFAPWDGYKNFQLAQKYGFQTLDNEWKRETCVDNYEQIDTIGYYTHSWFKFIKFGHQHGYTDICSQLVRGGHMTREEAVKLVNENDWKLDRKMLDDFLEFLEITEDYFWEVVDKYANKEILEKRDNVWRLKKPVR